MNASLEDLDFKKKYIAQSSENKSKMQMLAEKQREKQDAEYRAKQLNQAKMNQIIKNQSHLEAENKEMMKNDRVEMMEKNKIDPKIIEAARIRMENSDEESDSDDSAVIQKQYAREQNRNSRVDIVDKVFHGRPLMLKPPINPYSFNSYNHIPAPVQKEVKKRKKKKQAPQPSSNYDNLMKQLLEAHLTPKQQGQAIPIFAPSTNNDALDRLQKQMSAQHGMIREINGHVQKLKKDKDHALSQKKEQVLKLEQQFDEYDRFHKLRRNVDSLKDQIQAESNKSGVNRLRAAHGQEKLLDELKSQIDEVRLERSQKFRDMGSRSLKNFVPGIYLNQEIEISKSETEPKKHHKKSKNTEKEAEKKIAKIADAIVEKELAKRKIAKSGVFADQPNIGQNSKANLADPVKDKDYIETQHGMTIIPSSDPYKPPIVILPKKEKKDSDLVNSKKDTRETNPFDDYMDTLIKLQLMQNQQQQHQSYPAYPFDPFIIPLVDDLHEDAQQEQIRDREKDIQTEIGFELRMPTNKEPLQNRLFQTPDGENIAQQNLNPPRKIVSQPSPSLENDAIQIGKKWFQQQSLQESSKNQRLNKMEEKLQEQILTSKADKKNFGSWPRSSLSQKSKKNSVWQKLTKKRKQWKSPIR